MGGKAIEKTLQNLLKNLARTSVRILKNNFLEGKKNNSWTNPYKLSSAIFNFVVLMHHYTHQGQILSQYRVISGTPKSQRDQVMQYGKAEL